MGQLLTKGSVHVDVGARSKSKFTFWMNVILAQPNTHDAIEAANKMHKFLLDINESERVLYCKALVRAMVNNYSTWNNNYLAILQIPLILDCFIKMYAVSSNLSSGDSSFLTYDCKLDFLNEMYDNVLTLRIQKENKDITLF